MTEPVFVGKMPISEIIEKLESGDFRVVLPVAQWKILRQSVRELGRDVIWNCRQIGPIVHVWKATITTEEN